jgi:hypothetical protein
MVYIWAWQAAALQPGVDRFQHGAGGAERQAGAAIFFGDQRAEKAGFRSSPDEVMRVFIRLVQLHPVVVGEILAQLGHGIADFAPGRRLWAWRSCRPSMAGSSHGISGFR